jgi:adenylate cyclase
VRPDAGAACHWLVDGARSALSPDQVLSELCDRLIAGGVPLWRAGVFVRTLHPQVMGRRFLWREGAGVEVTEAPFDLFETEEFRGSPIAHVYATAAPLRRRLADPSCAIDFPMLDELRKDGATDYLVSPLVFTDGTIQVATWSTRQPGGFETTQVAAIEAIINPLARVAEIRALRRTASNLLDTYVGNHAGERIFSGQIRRGDTQSIDAAIWFSDMRGSTGLAGQLPPQDFIDLLNRFFDCQVPAILHHGGEVLKFMGDGVLAIFPLSERGSGVDVVCRRALAAAQSACAEVGLLPRLVADKSLTHRPRIGLGLHVGRVLYGNIGSGNRLDFTCIGPAVHLTARIEALAGRLGHEILASADFARHCGPSMELLGEFRLAGFVDAQTVYKSV